MINCFTAASSPSQRRAASACETMASENDIALAILRENGVFSFSCATHTAHPAPQAKRSGIRFACPARRSRCLHIRRRARVSSQSEIPEQPTKHPTGSLYFIQAAGLVYHRRTKCGVYHQPLRGCISSRASVHIFCGLMIYKTSF